MFNAVTEMAQEVLGPDAVALPFGSSANGCGEVSSDLDVVLYSPQDLVRNGKQEDNSVYRQRRNKHIRRILSKVLFKTSRRHGLVQEEARLHARIPIVALLSRDRSVSCDVSYKNYVPLFNSRLILAYAEFEPRLPVMVLFVKRIAKTVGMGSTPEGFISSYSWTLMTIYYLQVCHGLPSLHKAALHGPEPQPDRAFFTDFVTNATRPLVAEGLGPGALVRGFYAFFHSSFKWETEVVSVRLGTRTHVGNPQLHPSFKDVEGVGLNIEDPIQVMRNLNFALNTKRLKKLRDLIGKAHTALESGRGFPPSLLKECPELPRAWVEEPEKMIRRCVGCFLKVPFRRLVSECDYCGKVLEFGELFEHEHRCKAVSSLPLLLTKERPFGCTECNKTFKLEIGLLEHQAVKGHSGTAIHGSQREVPKELPSEATVPVPTAKMYGGPTEAKPLACAVCLKPFKKMEDLRQHLTNVGHKGVVEFRPLDVEAGHDAESGLDAEAGLDAKAGRNKKRSGGTRRRKSIGRLSEDATDHR